MTEKRARELLRAAIDRACIARGEVQWTNGYRCAGSQGVILNRDEQERLHQKEWE